MKKEKNQSKPMHPLLQELLDRLESAGEVVITPDGHIFLQPDVGIKMLWGAMDMKKEGREAGVRIIVRKVHKRARNSKYAGMPWLQVYVLPIVKKNTQTMTSAERHNMELHRQALRMAHAVEHDPEKAAYYHELHEAHKRNPEGYKKLYPNFFGFLVATFHMQLAAQAANPVSPASEKSPISQDSPDLRPDPSLSITPASRAGIRLCVPFPARRMPYLARAA